MNVSSFPVDTVLQGPEQGGSIQPIEVSALYSSFWRLVVVISSSELETPHFEQFESAAPHIQTPKMGATVSEERAVLMAACRNKAPRACAAPRPSSSAWAVPQGLSSLEPGSPLREHTAGRKTRDTALGSRTEERGKTVGELGEGAKGGRGKREKKRLEVYHWCCAHLGRRARPRAPAMAFGGHPDRAQQLWDGLTQSEIRTAHTQCILNARTSGAGRIQPMVIKCSLNAWGFHIRLSKK